MSQCVICEEPSPGFHAGTSCCRACAAFHRRTKQLKLQYICRFQKNCDVSKKNRFSCRYCRYQKCLLCGLKLGEELSKKSNNLEDGKEDLRQLGEVACTSGEADGKTAAEEDPSAAGLAMYGNPSLTNKDRELLLWDRVNDMFHRCKPLYDYNVSFPLTQIQQGILSLEKIEKYYPVFYPIVERKDIDFGAQLARGFLIMEHNAEFCMNLKEFSILPVDDKWNLYKMFWKRFCVLERLFATSKHLGFDAMDEKHLLHDGTSISLACEWKGMEAITAYKSDELKKVLSKTIDYFEHQLMSPFKRFKFDTFEVVYMILTVLWDVRAQSKVSSETAATAARIKAELVEELQNYYTFEKKNPNYADRIYKIVKMIASIIQYDEIRDEDEQIMQTFNIMAEDTSMKMFRM